MIKKKLTSLVLALSMTTAMTVSLSANAVPKYESWGDNFIPEEFADCIKLEDYDYLFPNYSGQYNVAMYMYQSSPDQIKLYNVYWYPDKISITIPDDASLLEKITAKAESIGESLTTNGKSSHNSKTYVSFRAVDADGFCNPISTNAASAFYELVKDDVEEYDFSYDIYLYQTGYMNYMTEYTLKHIEAKGVEIQDIQDFIDSEKINAEIRVDENSIRVVPNSDVSLEEHYKLMKKLYNEFGICCGGDVWLASAGESLNMGGTVDMKNAIRGDANDDSEITIADATAILQALGNPDKYSLSAQGEYNADVYGNGDGITPMDAITIQQYIAHIIESF